MPLSLPPLVNQRFWLVQAVFIGALMFPVFTFGQTSGGGGQRVIVISVDGLRPDLIQEGQPDHFPGFGRLMAEGAFTLNARVDPDFSTTLPNHISMMTGRFAAGEDGHSWFSNVDPPSGATIHQENGGYVQSVFDIVHDRGGRTGLFATKTKFSLFDQSYNRGNGAVDITGTDQGQNKIDTYRFLQSSSRLVDEFRSFVGADGFELAFLHFVDPDVSGHARGWDLDPVSAHAYSVRLVDHLILDILDFVASEPGYAGQTTVIVTADHGGTGQDHSDPEQASNYTIPFFVWGPGSESGSDLYGLNPTRSDPGGGHISRELAETQPPILNGDAANLALSVLGYPAVSGSTINSEQSLVVSSTTPQPQDPLPPVAAFAAAPSGLNLALDGTASFDPDGTLVSFQWSLGDGTTLTGPTVLHAFAEAGTYTVSLSVTDSQGLTSTVSETVTVEGSAFDQVDIAFQSGVSPTSAYADARDTKLRSDEPETAFGSDVQLEADGFPPYRVLLAWDLTTVPQNAAVLSGALTIDITNVSSDSYGLYLLERNWTESEATWLQADNQSPWDLDESAGDRGSELLATFVPSSLGELTIPLNGAGISELQRWVLNPSSNHGFVVDIASNASDGVDITSRESSNASRRPRLAISYSTDPNQSVNLPPSAVFEHAPDPPTVGEEASFDASGSFDLDGTISSYEWDFGDGTDALGVQVSHSFDQVGQFSVTLTVSDDGGASSSIQKSVTVLGESVSVLAFQDGASPSAAYSGSSDTKIRSDAPSTRFGDADVLEVDGVPPYSVLLRWDIDQVPAGAIVLSASISVTVTNVSPDTYELYELSRPWDEDTADWLSSSDGEGWTKEGAEGSGDRENTVVGRFRALNVGRMTIPLNESGIELVQRWIDLQDNFGFILQDYDRATDGIDFYSREVGDVSDRPRLEIEYTMQSSGAASMRIVSDSGHPVVLQGALEMEAADAASIQLRLVMDELLNEPMRVDAALTGSAREYRLVTESNRTAMLVVPTADSSSVDGRTGKFLLDRTLESGGVSMAVYTMTVGRGSTSIDVPTHGQLYVTGESAASSGATGSEGEVPPESANGLLSAYPNPFASSLHLEYRGTGSARVDVIDVLGRTVTSIQVEPGRSEVATDQIGPGTYILRLLRAGLPDYSVLVTKAW